MSSKYSHKRKSICWLIDTMNPRHCYGFINKRGTMVLEPRYTYARGFSEGLAAVGVKDRIGYINTNGEMVIAPVFHDGHHFSEGLAYVEQEQSVGFINTQGQWVIKIRKELNCRPEYPPDYAAGLALLKHRGKYRYFDRQGNIAIGRSFLAAQPFQYGFPPLAAVYNEKEDSWEYMDKKGNVIIRPALPAIFAYPFVCNYAQIILRDLERRCYINRHGSIFHADDCKMDYCGRFSEDLLAPAARKGKLGFIDTYGRFVIQPKFESASLFQEGLAFVQLKEKFGYVNLKGALLIIPFVEFCGQFTEGLAPVLIKSKGWGYVNKKGKTVIQPIYKDVWPFHEGLAAVRVK